MSRRHSGSGPLGRAACCRNLSSAPTRPIPGGFRCFRTATQRDGLRPSSSEIIRMLNSAFDAVGAAPGDFYPADLRETINPLNARICSDTWHSQSRFCHPAKPMRKQYVRYSRPWTRWRSGSRAIPLRGSVDRGGLALLYRFPSNSIRCGAFQMQRETSDRLSR